MNLPRKLLILGVSLIGTFIISHAATPNCSGKVSILKEKNKGSQSIGRPNAPSMHSIECSYEKGRMDLTFKGGINNVYVRLLTLDNNVLWDGYVSTIDNSIGIPELTGEYNIDCIDEYGNEFGGTLNFE